MKENTSYRDYIVYDVLGHIPGITFRSMFGGQGIYLNGAIIAIIAGAEVYFKANKELKETYMENDYYPFSYSKNGKTAEMNYVSVKATDLENREEIERRVNESYALSKKD